MYYHILFALPDTDSDSDPGKDIHPENGGTVVIKDPGIHSE